MKSLITFPSINICECSYILVHKCMSNTDKISTSHFHHSDHAPSLAWPNSKPISQLSLGTSRHIPPRIPASRVPLTRSTGTDRSSLSSSQAGRPRACDPSCASAWMRGWGSTPGRWCTGRVMRRCGCAGAWSWPNSPASAGGTACTRTASHLWGKRTTCLEFVSGQTGHLT